MSEHQTNVILGFTLVGYRLFIYLYFPSVQKKKERKKKSSLCVIRKM